MKTETVGNKFRLPKQIAEKWMASLRSGSYKQGNDMLCNGENYCCLGVVGSLCGYTDEFMTGDAALYPKAYRNVPDELKSGHELPRILADMNDSGKEFHEIADWIEQNVELY